MDFILEPASQAIIQTTTLRDNISHFCSKIAQRKGVLTPRCKWSYLVICGNPNDRYPQGRVPPEDEAYQEYKTELHAQLESLIYMCQNRQGYDVNESYEIMLVEAGPLRHHSPPIFDAITRVAHFEAQVFEFIPGRRGGELITEAVQKCNGMFMCFLDAAIPFDVRHLQSAEEELNNACFTTENFRLQQQSVRRHARMSRGSHFFRGTRCRCRGLLHDGVLPWQPRNSSRDPRLCGIYQFSPEAEGYSVTVFKGVGKITVTDEEIRERVREFGRKSSAALAIQNHFRGRQARLYVQRMRLEHAVLKIQSFWRGQQVRNRLQADRKKVILVQCQVRKWLAKRRLIELQKAAFGFRLSFSIFRSLTPVSKTRSSSSSNALKAWSPKRTNWLLLPQRWKCYRPGFYNSRQIGNIFCSRRRNPWNWN